MGSKWKHNQKAREWVEKQRKKQVDWPECIAGIIGLAVTAALLLGVYKIIKYIMNIYGW